MVFLTLICSRQKNGDNLYAHPHFFIDTLLSLKQELFKGEDSVLFNHQSHPT
jgi:ABC-type uncharacterized transport system substrate-binding protein